MTQRRMADLDNIASLSEEAPALVNCIASLVFLAIAVAAPHLLLLSGLVVLVANLVRPAVSVLLGSSYGAVALVAVVWGFARGKDVRHSLEQIGVGCCLGLVMAIAAEKLSGSSRRRP